MPDMKRADAHKYFLNMMAMLNVACLAGGVVILAQWDGADAVNDAKQYFIPVQCLIDLLGRASFSAMECFDSSVKQEPLLLEGDIEEGFQQTKSQAIKYAIECKNKPDYNEGEEHAGITNICGQGSAFIPEVKAAVAEYVRINASIAASNSNAMSPAMLTSNPIASAAGENTVLSKLQSMAELSSVQECLLQALQSEVMDQKAVASAAANAIIEAPARGILDIAFAMIRFGQAVSWLSASSTVYDGVAAGIAGFELTTDAVGYCVKPGQN